MTRHTCTHVVVTTTAHALSLSRPPADGRRVVRCEHCKRYRWETAEEVAKRGGK